MLRGAPLAGGALKVDVCRVVWVGETAVGGVAFLPDQVQVEAFSGGGSQLYRTIKNKQHVGTGQHASLSQASRSVIAVICCRSFKNKKGVSTNIFCYATVIFFFLFLRERSQIQQV